MNATDANALIVPTPISKEITPAHWTAKQRSRFFYLLRRAKKTPATCALMYWSSDPWGRSSNGGRHDVIAAPGAVHVSKEDLSYQCGTNLHASLVPHKWMGARVWIVALLGERRNEGDEKSWACKREVIGEVLPEEAGYDLRVGVRLGLKALTKADLGGADLRSANLGGANLGGANLGGANLGGADLDGADLRSANLRSANLRSANLGYANLGGADLRSANLGYANLGYANLGGADLRSADLRSADLRSANLGYANLGYANLGYANFGGATVLDRNLKVQPFADVWDVDPKTGIVTGRKS